MIKRKQWLKKHILYNTFKIYIFNTNKSILYFYKLNYNKYEISNITLILITSLKNSVLVMLNK